MIAQVFGLVQVVMTDAEPVVARFSSRCGPISTGEWASAQPASAARTKLEKCMIRSVVELRLTQELSARPRATKCATSSSRQVSQDARAEARHKQDSSERSLS